MGAVSVPAADRGEQAAGKTALRTSESLWLPGLVLVVNLAAALYLSYKI